MNLWRNSAKEKVEVTDLLIMTYVPGITRGNLFPYFTS
jgi:hypothetical protein